MAFHTGNGELILKRVTHGFTLVELMVVMAIIALLLSLALPRYFNHLESSREIILKQDLVVMRDASTNTTATAAATPTVWMRW